MTGSKSQGQHPAKLKQPQRSEPDPIGWWAMVLCALAVGTIAGFGAVVFRAMIAGFHNLMFLGVFSFDYDATSTLPPRHGVQVSSLRPLSEPSASPFW